MDYRYKPGDHVVVINEIQEGKDYYMRYEGASLHGEVICVSDKTIRQRKALEGTVVTISGYYDNRYVIKETDLKETDLKTLWTDDMFVGLAYGECYCESLL